MAVDSNYVQYLVRSLFTHISKLDMGYCRRI